MASSPTWVGARNAECGGLARALQVAATRGDSIGAVTIFSDAQAAIARMTTDEPGPGQQYALEARRHIAALRVMEPNAQIEIRWCPSHGIEGNEMADEWVKLAADEPDAHGVEWFSTTVPDGTVRERVFPLPQSLANVSEGSPSRNGQTPRAGRGKNLPGKYRPGEKQKPDPTVAKARKRLAARFYQLKTGHCLTGQYLAWTTRRPDATCWWRQYRNQTRGHLFNTVPSGRTSRSCYGTPS